MNRTVKLLAMVTAAAVLSSCKTNKETTPARPDYSDATQWYVNDRQGQADIFYIISTETGDYPLADGTTAHYADTYADSLRRPMLSEMEGVDTLVGGRLNFYAPYYRQCSLQSFVSDSLAAERLALPTGDVRRAFSYYLAHVNPDRPFILAGFSQGAIIALRLLSEMSDEVYSRMVAAYIIGCNVTPAMADSCRHLRPARGADDVGVTVSYNSVRNAACGLWPRSAVAINPVNWRTDTVTATLMTEPSPLLPIGEQQKDTLAVSLDTVSNLLIVSGYRGTDYVLPLIGREGNYHSREIWLYREQLRENMQRRVDAFRRGHRR